MIAMIDSFRAGLFQKKYWLPNIISGIIVGVVALPLAMAFAIASGAKPEQGLYTAIVAGFLVSLFGGSRVQIAGPTGAFIVILSGITAKYGMDGLQLATILAGFMLLFMGFLRLGVVIKFIPYPVIIGFTAGIAVVIWVGQWHHFFGIPTPQGVHFHEKLLCLIRALPHFNTTTTIMSCASLCVLLFVNKISWLKRVPAPLIVLVMGTSVQSLFQLSEVATIGSTFGGIPLGLPAFHLPNVSLNRLIELIGPAFTIAMLGAIESLLSAVVADGMSGTRHHSNQELMGQGIANIVAPLFGGFAATGAIARTATNVRNGGNSPLSGVVHALTLVLIILFLAPLAKNVPLSVLSAILFVVAWNMAELKHLVAIVQRAPFADVLIVLVTFSITIFGDLIMAVNIGVMIAILHFLLRMAKSVEVQQQSIDDVSRQKCSELPSGVLVYGIDGPFFFGAIDHFERALANTHTDPRVVIFRFGWVPYIDVTGLQVLDVAIRDLQKRGVRVMIVGAKLRVEADMRKAGILARLEPENLFKEIDEALSVVWRMDKKPTQKTSDSLST